MDLEGFQYENAPWVWSFQPIDYDVASMGQLVARFNENFSYSAKPLAWVRNPVRATEGTAYYQDDVIVIPYSSNFYVLIEKAYREIFGPHRVKLLYKAYQVPETYWLATLQLCVSYYSDDDLLIALTQAITNNEFYISERSAKIIVIK
jgi:hypothetical protein